MSPQRGRGAKSASGQKRPSTRSQLDQGSSTPNTNPAGQGTSSSAKRRRRRRQNDDVDEAAVDEEIRRLRIEQKQLARDQALLNADATIEGVASGDDDGGDRAEDPPSDGNTQAGAPPPVTGEEEDTYSSSEEDEEAGGSSSDHASLMSEDGGDVEEMPSWANSLVKAISRKNKKQLKDLETRVQISIVANRQIANDFARKECNALKKRLQTENRRLRIEEGRNSPQSRRERTPTQEEGDATLPEEDEETELARVTHESRVTAQAEAARRAAEIAVENALNVPRSVSDDSQSHRPPNAEPQGFSGGGRAMATPSMTDWPAFFNWMQERFTEFSAGGLRATSITGLSSPGRLDPNRITPHGARQIPPQTPFVPRTPAQQQEVERNFNLSGWDDEVHQPTPGVAVQASQVNQVIIPDYPLFTGEKGEGKLTPVDFMAKVNAFRAKTGYSDEVFMHKHLQNMFAGPAKDWYEINKRVWQNSRVLFAADFKKFYIETAESRRRINELTSRYQTADEDPFNFIVKRYRDMQKYCELTEKQSIDILIRLLRPEYKTLLRRGSYESFLDFQNDVKQAKTWHDEDQERIADEAQQKKLLAYKQGPSKEGQKTSSWKPKTPFYPKLQFAYPSKQTVEEKTTADVAKKQGQSTTISATPRMANDPGKRGAMTTTKRKDVVCYRCNKPGHFANECRSNPATHYLHHVRQMTAVMHEGDIELAAQYEAMKLQSGELLEDEDENTFSADDDTEGIHVGEDTCLNS